MRMGRTLLGAVAGLISAVVTIMLIEFAGRQVFPPPPGLDPGSTADMAKIVATQAMQFCADQAVQILGGMGFMRGTASERIYREVKVMMIGGGAEEIMKELAARQSGL